jgi:FxsC-like protein
MKLNRHRDDYMQFVDRLATKLIAAGTEAPLPELAAIPPMRDVPNPLHAYLTKRPAIRATGPNSARFAFVAASAREISGRRASMACYGDESGWFWRPFLPDAPESIGKFAQMAATNLNLRYSELPVNAGLIQELEDARRNNEAVIILADPWTISIADYARLMRAYDNLTLINCGVLVAWNGTDMETTANKAILERTLRDAFPQKTVLRPPGHEWDSVRSAPDLRLKLEDALTRLRMMIIEMCTPERKAESEELMSRAVDAGIPVSTKPTLWGPGGEPSR